MNWLDITVLVICIASFLAGLKTGLVMQVASLLGVILGIIFAGTLAQEIAPHLGNFTDNKGIMAYIIAFLLILLALNLIGAIINFAVKIVLLGLVNRIGGGVFGIISSVLIISVILTILVQYDNNKWIIKEEVREKSQSYPILLKIAEPIIPLLKLDKLKPILPTKDNQPVHEVTV